VQHGKFDEARTRKELIEKQLIASGWSPVTEYSAGMNYSEGAVREYETTAGPADYALFHNGEVVALVEAKKLSVGPQNVLLQAQRYAKGLRGGKYEFGDFHVPFIYSTNGVAIWFQDLRDEESRSRQVARFHTPSALAEYLSRDNSGPMKWLKATPNSIKGIRDYQKDAVQAVEKALPKKRKILLVMATGTGKTFVAVSQVYRLLKSGLARRILFLVDRRALVAQAVGAFSTIEPEPGLKFSRLYEVYSQKIRREDLDEEFKFEPSVLPTDYLTNPQPHHTFVYVCTIQRMRVNLFGKEEKFSERPNESEVEEDANKLDVPIHVFDVIIADECHRGYTATEESKWREVLDHFDAIKIGLTATPAAHTSAYFGDIVYRYDFQTAITQGHLVDYDPIKIESDITMKGLFLREGEEVALQDRETGRVKYEVLEDEREYDTSELEEKVRVPDRNKKIIEEFAKYARDQEVVLGRFPKTLVFAVNDLQQISHADHLVNLLRDTFGRGDDFVQKITGNPNVDRPLQIIRRFRNRPLPAIVVTVDMLTTGVDIPRLENLLFIRPVRSRILFDQMLGRGTRKCEDINKTHFTVYDAVGVLDYFSMVSDFTADPPAKPSRTMREIIEAIYGNQDVDYNTRVLIRRLQRIAKSVSADGRREFAKYVLDGDMAAFAASIPRRMTEDWGATMRLLRTESFLGLLEDYPQAQQPFVIAEGVQDRVASTPIFKTADGKPMKPEDYLRSFERFVRENPEQIDALRILLDRPSEFDVSRLNELRAKLAERAERFTEEKLRKAYHKELADIISMIRHAAKGDPLLSAQERVERAMNAVTKGRTFTREEEDWLDLIKSYLVNNILIEEPDFTMIPFSRHGGWHRANAVFQGKLPSLLKEINLAMVSAE
jgi:type I restriction enzyme R subunit